MEVLVLEHSDNIEILRSIGEEWASLTKDNTFGFPIDLEIGLQTMKGLKDSPNGDVLVLAENDIIVGFMGLTYANNHVGHGKIMNECCFFVSERVRSGGVKLIKAALELGRSKGCNFSTINASKIAGNGERSGKLYEHFGYEAFEVSYLKAI